jgi:hypothetical protein
LSGGIAWKGHDSLLCSAGKFRIELSFSVDAQFKFGSKTDARTITFDPESIDFSFARAIRFPFRPAVARDTEERK